MRFSSLMLIIGVAATVQSAAVPKSHALHERRDAASSKQWVKREQLSPSAILPMRIGLKQQNLEHGHEYLMDMYAIHNSLPPKLTDIKFSSRLAQLRKTLDSRGSHPEIRS